MKLRLTIGLVYADFGIFYELSSDRQKDFLPKINFALL